MTAEAKPQRGREHEVGTLIAPLLTLDSTARSSSYDPKGAGNLDIQQRRSPNIPISAWC